MTTGSSSWHQLSCCVNGCQRWRRSAAASSGVLRIAAKRSQPVGRNGLFGSLMSVLDARPSARPQIIAAGLVKQAGMRGIAVDFDLSAPGPLWAMAQNAPAVRYAGHWSPSAQAWGQFVTAVGTRYSGRYTPPGASALLPRVSFWSIWNEP